MLAGLSASAMLGTRWIDGETPAELIHGNRRPPPGIVVYSDDLDPWEVQTIGEMAVTTAARTGFDLGRRLPLAEGVPRIDALLNATQVKVADIEHILAARPGARGVRQLRQTLALVDGGAESPYESMTRMLLVQKGFPRPETQIVVRDDNGRAFAHIDMGWPRWCVGVDFEGKQHWTDPKQRDWDVERYSRLPELDWIDVRLTARVLHREPETFLDRVSTALISRGCPKTWCLSPSVQRHPPARVADETALSEPAAVPQSPSGTQSSPQPGAVATPGVAGRCSTAPLGWTRSASSATVATPSTISV